MIMTASKLRGNIYKVLDRVLDTGVPVEIFRRGKTLKIVSGEKKSKLANLKKHDAINGNPEDLVHIDWTHLWKS